MSNLFLLDVDGVVNAVPIWGPRPPKPCPWPGGWDAFDANGYRITYAPELTKALLDIHESGLAEVRWLTTWGNHANVHLAEQFGFPEFEVVGSPPRTYGETEWWKLPLAQGAISMADKTVWADDDIARSEAAVKWIGEQTNLFPLIPHPHEGLTPTEIHLARLFLEDDE